MSSSMSHRFPLLAAAIFGLTGVALGALGAHRLEPMLAERGMTRAWETGARYHLYHAIALLALAALVAAGRTRPLIRWTAWCWTVGILLFSGSLYGFALGGPHVLVYVTPLGGVALLAGWAGLLIAGLKKEEGPRA
jgi:uncharacterized membrane protein YgdD (TMEM256/DUF423 family)